MVRENIQLTRRGVVNEALIRRFLAKVWGAQPVQGFGYITWKKDGWRTLAVDLREGRTLDRISELIEELKIPNHGRDLYFTPCLFSSDEGRREEYVLPSKWLYADLDEVDPRELNDITGIGENVIRPSLAWETSRKRFQCLWLLDGKPLKTDSMLKLNQHLTYKVGADRGGWHASKVLRIPGSVSTKYEKPFNVRIIRPSSSVDKRKCTARALWKQVKDAPVGPQAGGVGGDNGAIPSDLDLASVKVSLKDERISSSIRRVLKGKPQPHDDRSSVLWKLYKKMHKAGFSSEEILVLVRKTAWNKYKGQRRELTQLWKEINKAGAHVEKPSSVSSSKVNGAEPTSKSNSRLKPTSFREFVTADLPTPTWLVEGIWSDKAHGLVAGEAKAYKTLCVLDLSVSVASGTKFLNHFEVPKQGPVVVIQNENSPSLIQDRVTKIARSRGLFGGPESIGRNNAVIDFTESDLPLHFLNNVELDLGDEDDLEELDNCLEELNPEMLVLDPWYLMTPGVDENSAKQVGPILNALMQLKRKHDCGILMVHHYNKPTETNSQFAKGYRISGSSVFYRWVESALYVEKGDEPMTAKITPEHREFPAQGSIHAEFELGDFNDHSRESYSVFVEWKKEEGKVIRQELLKLVKAEPGITVPQVAETLAIRPDRVRRLVERGPYKTRTLKGTGQGRPPKGLYLRSQ